MTGRHFDHIIHAVHQELLMPPWPLAFELSKILPHGSWTLIGGLMVQMRAMIHNLPIGRATQDVDGTLHFQRGREVRYKTIAEILLKAGFSPVKQEKFAYRFTRETSMGVDMVDLMFPDGVSDKIVPKISGRPVLSVPAGRRASMDRERVLIDVADNSQAILYIPSLRDSLVIKGAAYLVDTRNPERHLIDAVTLVACVEDVQRIRDGLSLRSRKRVRALLRGLESRKILSQVDPILRDLALDILPEMRARFDVDGNLNPKQARKLYG